VSGVTILPEVGHLALILALIFATLQGLVPLLGLHFGIERWVAQSRRLAWGQLLFLALSFAFLTQAFIDNDFSVLYTAQHSNSQLPLIYRISAVWGGHEGSLLLWALLLAAWAGAVALFSRRLPEDMVARVMGIMGLVSSGFLMFILFTSNPFLRLLPAPIDGSDLNPLLQDPGLVVHPPMLYMGYVGFSVAFAFAIAALLGGKLDATWARWSRPWTTLAWIFMTLGIVLGSWWAYYELGWGGWWFWDPVENASFMPWLVGTALIHSLAVAEKRSAFKNWTVLLAIITFSLSLLGTFLVRSGVLTSVHAFASDPARGVFILGLLAVEVGGSLLLYALRAPSIKSTGRFAPLSREGALLVNNLLLVVMAATILIGTLYPLIMDALGIAKMSVGEPYFNTVFNPLAILLVLLMGLGPLLRWKSDTPLRHVRLLAGVGLAALAGAALLPWLGYGSGHLMVVIGVGVSLWMALLTCADLYQRSRTAKGLRFPGMSYLGMVAAHLGVAVTVIGVTLTSHYSTEHDIRLGMGETVTIGGYDVRFDGLSQVQGPNYRADRGHFLVSQAGAPVADLYSEKRLYTVSRMPMTEAGIDAGLFRDIYVALGEPLPDGAWALRVYHKPYVRWIWLGGLLMALGGLLALLDRRYRQLPRTQKEA